MGIAFSFLEKILDKLPVMNLEVDFSVLNGFLPVGQRRKIKHHKEETI